MHKNNLKMLGAGPRTLMFAHGLGCDQRMWRHLVPAFQDTHRVVLFDHVGAGNSDLSAYDAKRYSSLHGYADDVVELCRELNLRDVVFVGHSVSATIGLLAGIKAPDRFRALVLVAPSPCFLNDGDYRGGFSAADIDGLIDALDANYIGWSRSITPVIMGNAERPELTEELTESFCRTDPDIARQFARVTFTSDHRADLPQLSRPALVMQCRNDAIANDAVGAYVHSRLPSSQLVRLNATGHCPHLSAPAEVIAELSAYLRQLDA